MDSSRGQGQGSKSILCHLTGQGCEQGHTTHICAHRRLESNSKKEMTVAKEKKDEDPVLKSVYPLWVPPGSYHGYQTDFHRADRC